MNGNEEEHGRGVKRKVWCATLGCDKNLVDSEALLGMFAGRGVAPTDDPEEALRLIRKGIPPKVKRQLSRTAR